MAEVGELTVALRLSLNEFNQGIVSANKSIKDFSSSFIKNYGAISATVAAVGAVLVTQAAKAIRAYGEQEEAVSKLAQALKLQGVQSKATTTELVAFATQMQRTKNVADEAVIAMQAQLVTYGLHGEQLKRATAATIDFAQATGRDLTSAANTLGQALAGRAMELKRYGIEINESMTRSEKLDVAVKGLEKSFGGFGDKLRGTTLGSMTQFQLSVDDLYESVGSFLSSPAIGFTTWLTKLVQRVTDGLNTMSEFAAELGGLGRVIKMALIELLRDSVNMVAKFMKTLSALNPLFRLVGVNVDEITKRLNDQIDEWQSSTYAATQSGKAAEKAEDNKRIALRLTQQELENSRKKAEDVAQAETEAFQTAASNTLIARQSTEAQIRAEMGYTTAAMQAEANKQVMDAQNSFQAQATFGQAFAAQMADYYQSVGFAAATIFKSAADSFTVAAAQIIVKGGDWKEAMRGIFDQMLIDFVKYFLEQMLLQFLVYLGLMKSAQAASGIGQFGGAGFGGGGIGIGLGAGGGGGGGFSPGVMVAQPLGTVPGVGTVGTPYPSFGSRLMSPGGGGGAAGAGLMVGGAIVGQVGGTYVGGMVAGKNDLNSQRNAQMGAAVGTAIGSIWGPLGAAIGGLIGGTAGGGATQARDYLQKTFGSDTAAMLTGGLTDVHKLSDLPKAPINQVKGAISTVGKVGTSIGKSIKKAFSGGIVGEPGWIISDSGEMARVGEEGPEALISFRDRGLTPKLAASAVMNANAAGTIGGGGNITININGMFLEGDSAMWQRLVREKIVPEIRTWTMRAPSGPFMRQRGVAS